MQFNKESFLKAYDSVKGLGKMRLISLGLVGTALLGSLAAISIYNNSPQKTLLYSDLELNEAAEMVDDLTKDHIVATTSPDGKNIYVPKNKVAEARLLLAKAGLPGGGVVGYELFDKNGTLTSTQFEQGIDQTRAMEGELERSIRLLHGVRNVRVHLVLPHRDLFSTETNPAQASVILDIGRAGAVSNDSITAIQNLVAAAVPGLQSHSISIVDTRGEVLAQPGDPDSLAGQESSLEKQRHAEEIRLSQSVEDILSPTIGMGHVRARVAVTMNTDLIHETQESYDPDEQVLRSQTTSSDKSSNSENDPGTSVGNNLPNANAGNNNKSGSQEDREDETNNYEIGKRVRVINQTRPRVSRLSIAVMVDGETTKDEHGKVIWKPLSDDKIKQLTNIVESTIGYDKDRGDKVNVVSMPFKIDNGVDFAHDDGTVFTHDMIVLLIECSIPAILIILAGLLIVRPILKHKKEEKRLEEERRNTPIGKNIDINVDDKDDSVKVEGVNGNMKRESVIGVINNVEQNPDDSLSVIRNWIAETNEMNKKRKGDDK